MEIDTRDENIKKESLLGAIVSRIASKELMK
jgi:hypothetical protein